MTGTFIVFEGGEGSGKSRHSRYVAEELQAAGYQVLHTHEPGGTAVGKQIRDIILSTGDVPLQPRAELFLFLADRAQHVESVIKPAIAAGMIVICDRFSGSTFAYQLGARGLDQPDFVTAMDAYARNGEAPDLVLYLDIDPAVGLQRKRQGDEELNRLDNEELAFHQRVREHFQQQAEQHSHWFTYGTDGPKEENSQHILQTIRTRLNL